MSGDHTKREITVTRVEFAVPSGADIKDFGIVEEWAWQDYARRNALDPKGGRDDNWCEVHARDEEVVFAFTVETQAGRDWNRDALDRVTTLLARRRTQDAVQPEWIQAVRDAIEGKS